MTEETEATHSRDGSDDHDDDKCDHTPTSSSSSSSSSSPSSPATPLSSMSTSTTNETTTSTSVSDVLPPDEGRIALATSFLRNAMRGGSTIDEGRRYLEYRAAFAPADGGNGMTAEEIDEAMRRIVEEGGGGVGGGGGGRGGGGRRGRQTRRGNDNDDYDDDDGGGDGNADDESSRSRERRHDDDDDDDRHRRSMRRRRDDRHDGLRHGPRSRRNRHLDHRPHRRDEEAMEEEEGGEGHRPPPPPSSWQQSARPTTTFPPPPPPPMNVASTSTSSLGHWASWAGGASFGVLSLAALRWLNGGDFVLFPPPAGGGMDCLGRAAIDRALSSSASHWKKGGEDDDDDEVEEDEEDDADEEEDDDDDDDDDDVGEDADGGGNEGFDDDDDDVDVALKMILNGSSTADADDFGDDRPSHRDRRRRRSSPHRSPSYDELVSEIRSLTSAIRRLHVFDSSSSSSSSSSRPGLAVVDANAGRAVTNDAMDFLKRLKRKEEEEGKDKTGGDGTSMANSEGDGGVGGVRGDENDAIDGRFQVVVAMLEEISHDLMALKGVVISPCRSELGDEVGGGINDPESALDNGDGNGDEVVDSAHATLVRVGEMSGHVDDVKGADENGRDLGGRGAGGPVGRIDLVVEKIQRALAIVGSTSHSKAGEGMVSDDVIDERGETAPAKVEGGESGEQEPQSTQGVETMVEGEPRENDISGVTSCDVMTDEHVQLEDDVKIQQNKYDSANLDEGGENSDNGISVVGGEVPIEITSQEASYPNSSEPTTMIPEGEVTSDLDDALRKLASSNDANLLKAGAQMLYLYCLNISKNPSVPRYRKIYTNNSTFRNKVGNLVGAREFLVAVGFVERPDNNLFEWPSSFLLPQSDDNSYSGVDSSWTTRSKLDFAMVALELMKNGKAGGS
jgi:hypothetical protein